MDENTKKTHSRSIIGKKNKAIKKRARKKEAKQVLWLAKVEKDHQDEQSLSIIQEKVVQITREKESIQVK